MYSEAPSNTTSFPRIARLWLLSGVGALGVAGLYVIVLVVARTPKLQKIPEAVALFHRTLVAHVDLSVLVWFLAVACLVWSIEAARGRTALRIPFLEEAALGSFTLGAVLMALSPFSRGEPLMSNYIPVITSPIFFLGLSLFGCGVALQLVHYFLHIFSAPKPDGCVAYAQYYGAFTAAIITTVSIACFVWAVPLMPAVFTGRDYYDLLFWGGGHVLQFTHTQMLIVAWAARSEQLSYFSLNALLM